MNQAIAVAEAVPTFMALALQAGSKQMLADVARRSIFRLTEEKIFGVEENKDLLISLNIK